ncbi:MAG: DUF4040 domain-containing protein [Prochloraceae cyanobacterium]
MSDSYIYVIIALLPLTSLMLVSQVNPYHALIIRAIVGEVAALVYALLGAVDVALTEALLGTMLTITLYAIAIRSSLVMRLGIVETSETDSENIELIPNLKKIINKYHLRLELVKYPNSQALERALIAKEVHATCSRSEALKSQSENHIAIRVRRLFEIIQSELTDPKTILTYVTVSDGENKH